MVTRAPSRFGHGCLRQFTFRCLHFVRNTGRGVCSASKEVNVKLHTHTLRFFPCFSVVFVLEFFPFFTFLSSQCPWYTCVVALRTQLCGELFL